MRVRLVGCKRCLIPDLGICINRGETFEVQNEASYTSLIAQVGRFEAVVDETENKTKKGVI